MIDSREEVVYPLAQLRQYVPKASRTGNPIHPSVIGRWIKRGLRAGDGTTVHLGSLKVGATLCSSREALERFFAELTARAGLDHRPAAVSEQRKRATSQALVAAGLKA